MKESKEGRALLPNTNTSPVSSLTPASKFQGLSPFGNSDLSTRSASPTEILPPSNEEEDYRMFVSQFRKMNPSRYESIFRPGEASFDVSTSTNISNSNNDREKRWIISSSSQIESNRITVSPSTTEPDDEFKFSNLFSRLSFADAVEKLVKLRQEDPAKYESLFSTTPKNDIGNTLATSTMPTNTETPFITNRPLREDERKILADLRKDVPSEYNHLFPSLDNNEVSSTKEAPSTTSYSEKENQHYNNEMMKVSSSSPQHLSTTSSPTASYENRVEITFTKYSPSSLNRVDASAETTSLPPTPSLTSTLSITPDPTSPTAPEPTGYSFLDPYTVEATMTLSEFRRQYPSEYQSYMLRGTLESEDDEYSTATTIRPWISETTSPSLTTQQMPEDRDPPHTTTEKPVSTQSEFRRRYPVEYDYVYNKGGNCDSVPINTYTPPPNTEDGYNEEDQLPQTTPINKFVSNTGGMNEPSTTTATLTRSQLNYVRKVLGTSALFSQSYSDYLSRGVSPISSKSSVEKSETQSKRVDDSFTYSLTGKDHDSTKYLTTSEYYRMRNDGAVATSMPADESSLNRKFYEELRIRYHSAYNHWFTTIPPSAKSLSSSTDESAPSEHFSSDYDSHFSRRASHYLHSRLSKTFKGIDSMF